MRYWKTVHPDKNNQPVTTIMSDRDILEEYYPTWRENMLKKYSSTMFNRELYQNINYENCIDDWVTVNWASEVTLDITWKKERTPYGWQYTFAYGDNRHQLLVRTEECCFDVEPYIIESGKYKLMEYIKERNNHVV